MEEGLTITMTREQATRLFNILSGFCNEQGAKSLRATEAGNAVMAMVYQRGSDQAYELVKIVGEALRPIERAGYRLVPKAEHDALLAAATQTGENLKAWRDGIGAYSSVFGIGWDLLPTIAAYRAALNREDA